MNKNLMIILTAFVMIGCSGTVPSIGNETAVQTTEENNQTAQQQEVSVETFTVQEPESPPIPVTVFEPYMIKRGDFLTKIALREYGDASVFASGLIVDGLAAFNQDLWRACDTVLGFGEDLETQIVRPEYPTKKTNKELAEYFLKREQFDQWFNKIDWVRRVNQFAERYFGGDVKRATYCLKHVSLWKTWCDLKREYKEIDWTSTKEEIESHINADTLAASSCHGGKCDLI